MADDSEIPLSLMQGGPLNQAKLRVPITIKQIKIPAHLVREMAESVDFAGECSGDAEYKRDEFGNFQYQGEEP